MDNKFFNLITALIIALAFLLGSFFIGGGLSKFRTDDRYVTMKGLAEMDVKADLAVWPIGFTATGDILSEVQDKIEADTVSILKFLESQGIKKEDISIGRILVTDLLAQSYRPQGELQSRFIVNSTVNVRTDQVDVVTSASQKTGNLVRKGVVLTEYTGPSYIFTKLNDIKPEMIASATANARTAAEKFAKDSGSKIGKIRRANQGMFIILPRDESLNIDEKQVIDKKVRVVSTIEYFLKS